MQWVRTFAIGCIGLVYERAPESTRNVNRYVGKRIHQHREHTGHDEGHQRQY
jgi:hypothetical protein